jgi:hypothetical protein
MKQPLIYLAQPMSGRLWAEVMKEARDAAWTVSQYELAPWSPPLKEGAKIKEWEMVLTSPETLKGYWKQDKAALKKCQGMISIRGDISADGVGYEMAMAKYFYGIPTVVVSKSSIGRISHLEADFIALDMHEACEWMQDYLYRQAVKAPAKKKRKR